MCHGAVQLNFTSRNLNSYSCVDETSVVMYKTFTSKACKKSQDRPLLAQLQLTSAPTHTKIIIIIIGSASSGHHSVGTRSPYRIIACPKVYRIVHGTTANKRAKSWVTTPAHVRAAVTLVHQEPRY